MQASLEQNKLTENRNKILPLGFTEESFTSLYPFTPTERFS